MKVSEITVDEIIANGSFYEEDRQQLNIYLAAAKSFVKNYTGLNDAEIDEIEDMTLAVFALVNDFFNNRDFTTNTTRLNPAIRSILGMYSVNLI